MPDQTMLVPLIGILIVGAFVVLGVSGLLIFQRLLERRLKFSEETNNDVIFFASAIGVFYSLVMGLIAVGVWSDYSQTQVVVSDEAAAIAALYHDVTGLPEPLRSELQRELREYTTHVIEQEWPAQARGEALDSSTRMLNTFQASMYGFQPQTLGQQAIYSELLDEYNEMITHRRRRIDAMGGTLPGVMWAIILIGAFLAITVTYLLKIERPTHILLTAFLALFVGLVVFVVYGMDSPLSGPLAIGPESYQLVLEHELNLR